MLKTLLIAIGKRVYHPPLLMRSLPLTDCGCPGLQSSNERVPNFTRAACMCAWLQCRHGKIQSLHEAKSAKCRCGRVSTRNAITGLGRRDDVVRSPGGVVHVTRTKPKIVWKPMYSK